MKLSEKLSEHFTAKEFLVSAEHPEIIEKYTEIPEEIGLRLKKLCIEVEKVRSYVMKPIKVLSGWRPDELNELIGGADDSDHKYGMACDFTGFFDIKSVFEWIKTNKNIRYRQVIYYPKQKFIHLSINDSIKPEKRQCLIK